MRHAQLTRAAAGTQVSSHKVELLLDILNFLADEDAAKRICRLFVAAEGILQLVPKITQKKTKGVMVVKKARTSGMRQAHGADDHVARLRLKSPCMLSEVTQEVTMAKAKLVLLATST